MVVKKIDYISFIKTIMMLLVVFYHSCLFFEYNWWFTYTRPIYRTEYLCVLVNWLNSFHVHTFVMCSGFLFYYSKSINSSQVHKQNVVKRFNRLLLPYVFVGFLWVLPIKMIFKYNMGKVITGLLLGTYSDQLWFLLMLFFVFLIFEFIYDKIKISNFNFLIILVVSSIIYYFLCRFNIQYFQLHSVFKFIPFFYLGGYLYYKRDTLSFSINKVNILLGFIYLILIFCFSLNNIFPKLNCILFQFLSVMEVVIVYIVFVFILRKKKNIVNNKIYKILERNSFGIYLFHQQIIYFCIVIFNGVVPPVTQVILSFIISLLISLCISIILSKNKLAKKMFGL